MSPRTPFTFNDVTFNTKKCKEYLELIPRAPINMSNPWPTSLVVSDAINSVLDLEYDQDAVHDATLAAVRELDIEMVTSHQGKIYLGLSAEVFAAYVRVDTIIFKIVSRCPGFTPENITSRILKSCHGHIVDFLLERLKHYARGIIPIPCFCYDQPD